MDRDEPKQLKLTPKDLPKATPARNASHSDAGRQSGGQGKKEKDPKGNKWVIFVILVISVIVSLVFYFSGKRPDKGVPNQDSPLGGQKVYRF